MVQQMDENTNVGSATKTMTPVSEPMPSQRWNGQECRAVLAHCGRSVARGKEWQILNFTNLHYSMRGGVLIFLI